MGLRDYFKLGDYNAICDVCGFKRKASELKRRWDGKMVCEEDFEYRNPQDFVRASDQRDPLPWTRPEPADQFIDPSHPVKPSDL